jgi:hypothetical protein
LVRFGSKAKYPYRYVKSWEMHVMQPN